jgi:hypothetical protein
VMDKSGGGAGFLRELRFPLPIYIPSTSPQSSSLSPEAGTIGQEWPHKPKNKENATSRKVARWSPDEVDLFLIHLILSAALRTASRLSL